MRLDKFSDLPDWNDEQFHSDEDEGEGWKPNPTRDACKALYQQWQQVMFLLRGILPTELGQPRKDEEFFRETAHSLLGDAFVVGAKIKSSEAGNIYILRMENAAIIRQLAQQIASSLLLFGEDNVIDESHIDIVRSEIDKFRLLFIEWVKTFEKDDITDDWQLFV